MFIEIDMTTVPPGLELHEADDLTSLKVVVPRVGETSIAASDLEALAGERAADPAWSERFAEMIAYAGSKGWVAPDGAVRAHVEWPD